MITQEGGVPRGDTRLEALGWTHVFSGKVRDLYTSAAAPGRVLVVASDRVSAFDHVLEPSIPHKGALLTQLSLWWFGRLGMRNHLAAAHPSLGEHLPPGIARKRFEFFQAHQIQKNLALTHDIGSRHIVRHAIDPGSYRAAGIVPLEAAPQLKMNVLNKIPAPIWISLISSCEPFKRRSVIFRSVLIEAILALGSRQDARNSSHIQGSRQK